MLAQGIRAGPPPSPLFVFVTTTPKPYSATPTTMHAIKFAFFVPIVAVLCFLWAHEALGAGNRASGRAALGHQSFAHRFAF